MTGQYSRTYFIPSNMTIQEQADMIIAYLQENGLSHDQMLEVIALARKKLEAIKAEEQLNKPNKQIKIFEG